MTPTPIICWLLLLHKFVHSSVSSCEKSDVKSSLEKNSRPESAEGFDSDEPKKVKTKYIMRSDNGFFTIEPNYNNSNEQNSNEYEYYETHFDSNEHNLPYRTILQKRSKNKYNTYNNKLKSILSKLKGSLSSQQIQFDKSSKFDDLLRSIDETDYVDPDFEMYERWARARHKKLKDVKTTSRPGSLKRLINEHIKKQKRRLKKLKHIEQLSMMYDYRDKQTKGKTRPYYYL